MAIEYLMFAILSGALVTVLSLRRRLQVVEIHAPPDFLIVAGIIPRLLGARLILDIRDLSRHLWSARFGARKRSRAVIAILRRVEREACVIADRVVTVHEQYRQELARNAVAPSKIDVVMNTPDERLILGTIRASAGRRRPGFTIAYHGTVTTWYGVELVIEAIADLRKIGLDAHGLVLGEGDQLPAVGRLAQVLKVADAVTFSDGYLPREEVLRQVSVASCGVIPNPPTQLNRFILPNKLFEYVALGVPVVSARLETIAEYFDDEDVTFFEPGDASSLTDALLWVAMHEREASAKAGNAAKRAEKYRWRVNQETYVKVLDGTS
jgi:glycosyltransferase involved in cell wall biosynthesis